MHPQIRYSGARNGYPKIKPDVPNRQVLESAPSEIESGGRLKKLTLAFRTGSLEDNARRTGKFAGGTEC